MPAGALGCQERRVRWLLHASNLWRAAAEPESLRSRAEVSSEWGCPTRNCWRLTSPVRQQVVQRPIQRDARRPAKLAGYSARIADEHRGVGWPQTRRINPNLDWNPRSPEQHIQEITNDHRPARADVVGSAGPAAFDDQSVRL